MKFLSEYEPFPDEYRFKKRTDISYFTKLRILLRWYAVRVFVPKYKYLSRRYPTGMIPPRELRTDCPRELSKEEHYALLYKLSKWRAFLNNLNKLVKR